MKNTIDILHTFGIYMSDFVKILLFISLFAAAGAGLVFLVTKICTKRSPFATRFGAVVEKDEESGAYILGIMGCKDLWEDDYHILFRLADESEITICDTDLNYSQRCFVKRFTKEKRIHGFVITECPKGKRLLILDIINEYITQTIYVPFEIKDEE